jgi:NitT/TauT family transport system permease protein
MSEFSTDTAPGTADPVSAPSSSRVVADETARVLVPGSTIRAVVAPIVFGAAFVGLWQLAVTAGDIEPYVVPAPSEIATDFAANFSSVLSGAARTGVNALIGLVVGGLLGVLGAVVASLVRVADGLAAPLVAALSVMPIVALAPVLYTMYGADAETARQLVAGLAVLIPVYLNTLRGLRQVAPVHRDLMRSYAASPAQRTLAVTLPTAAPYTFTGLRIASSLAVISALVAEYFGGPVSGLGKSITSAASSSNYPLAWAYVLGAIGVGLVFYGVTLGVERFVTRHQPDRT